MAVQRRPGSRGRTTPVPGRHFDDGRSLQAFADRVAVRCHRCDRPGWVLASWLPYRWAARFRCIGCSAAVDSAVGVWVGAVAVEGRRPCGYCGHRWVGVRQARPSATTPVPETLPGKCVQCGRISEVTVTVRPLRDAQPSDPHFGLPLRLVESTRAGVLWAYNGDHLQALHDYAVATLREHGPVGNSSMFSRLPHWMKLARNRVLLQKATARLIAKAGKAG